jgi:hypothetical protein
MPKTDVKSNLTHQEQQKDKWLSALTDGQAQLVEAKKRVIELEAAVRICRRKVQMGKPWPGLRATAELPATQN